MRNEENGPAEPWFTVSAAAELAGMHPQTLRQYDRLGLVSPSRTKGRGRRYSGEDLAVLREVQRLSKEEGVNLAGVALVLELRERVRALESEIEFLQQAALSSSAPPKRVFAADPAGDVRQRPPVKPAGHGGARPGPASSSNTGKQVQLSSGAKRRASLISAAALQGWQRLAYLQLTRSYQDWPGRAFAQRHSRKGSFLEGD